MPIHVSGAIREIVYAQFDPNEDLLEGIEFIAIQRRIRAGLVLSITGGLVKARLAYFPHPGPLESTSTRTHEIPGPMEATGQGLIGIRHDGSPYVHVHLTVTNGPTSIMGHLEKGTLIRSLLPKSHFTIILASVEGVSLKLLEDHELSERAPERFPVGAVYHELRQL